jgi:hypothetical protein
MEWTGTDGYQPGAAGTDGHGVSWRCEAWQVWMGAARSGAFGIGQAWCDMAGAARSVMVWQDKDR